MGYDPNAQPWLMRLNGKGGRKYKGIREGGVSENTTFYVFTHGKDGAFEAFPISDWYNFTPIQRYKTLDADEAEERYAQRGKILNKWAVMVNKKLKPEDEGGEGVEEEEEKGKKGKKKDSFKVTDMDEWDDEGDALDTSEDEDKKDDSDSESGKKKNKSKDTKKRKKKNKTDVDEALEDSDEGREVDYMSDESSDSEEELEKDHDIKGVDQDEGISKMLDSDESSDDEKKKSGDDDDDDEDETGKKKKTKEESDEETEDKKGKKKKSGSAASSRSATPTKEMEKQERDQKRKAMVANLLDPNAVGGSQAKKSRLEQFGSSGATSSSAFGDITEEAVRRYLKRRPMTTTDLLKKFKSKKSGANSQELVKHLADLLKKINPQKQKTQGTVYLSLKE